MVKKSEKTRQGLDNVGFIGMRIAKVAFGHRGNEEKMPSSARNTVVCFRYPFKAPNTKDKIGYG